MFCGKHHCECARLGKIQLYLNLVIVNMTLGIPQPYLWSLNFVVQDS